MNHPILVAALAEDRRRQCSCGAVTQEPNGTCRRCRAAAVSRHDTARSSRRIASCWTPAGIAKAEPVKLIETSGGWIYLTGLLGLDGGAGLVDPHLGGQGRG